MVTNEEKYIDQFRKKHPPALLELMDAHLVSLGCLGG